MTRDPVRDALAALAAAARRPHDEDTIALVRATLGHRSNHVVARAACLVADTQLNALADDLIAAFPRFLGNPIRRDPGCRAKTEIAAALLTLAHPAADVYLRGAAHVQREPAFGPPVDTAAELRATCAMGLVVTEHPAALVTAVDLLVDPEPVARAGGLRALAASGRPDVALLMRLYALRGDRDPGVLAEAFGGLLTLKAESAVAFVAERLAAGDVDVARAAALALGEAREAEAVAALRQHLPGETRPEARHAVIVALATSRRDEAFDALLDLVALGTPADSRAAVEALGLFAHDAALQERVRIAVASRSVAQRPAGGRAAGRARGADAGGVSTRTG